MFDQFNPFGAEKYKMEVKPDVPASRTYDQELDKLANGAPKEAAKKFSELGKRYPESDWARKGSLMTVYASYQAGEWTDAETAAEKYLKEYANSPTRRMSRICRPTPITSKFPTSRATRTSPPRRSALSRTS